MVYYNSYSEMMAKTTSYVN